MFPTGYARCAGFHFVRDRFAAPLLLCEIVARSQDSRPLKRRSLDHGQTQHSGYSLGYPMHCGRRVRIIDISLRGRWAQLDFGRKAVFGDTTELLSRW